MSYRQEIEAHYGIKVADADIIIDTETEFVYLSPTGPVGWSKATFEFWRNRRGDPDYEEPVLDPDVMADVFKRCT